MNSITRGTYHNISVHCELSHTCRAWRVREFTWSSCSKFKLVWHQFSTGQFRHQFIWKVRSVQFGTWSKCLRSGQFIQFSSRALPALVGTVCPLPPALVGVFCPLPPLQSVALSWQTSNAGFKPALTGLLAERHWGKTVYGNSVLRSPSYQKVFRHNI